MAKQSYFPSIHTRHGSVTITIDGTRLNNQFAKAQQYLGDQVLTDCTPLVPTSQQGMLRKSGHVENDGSEVVWDSPYARYQYYGMKMIGNAPKTLTDIPLVQHTSGTVPFWFEQAKSANLDSWVSTVKQIAGGG